MVLTWRRSVIHARAGNVKRRRLHAALQAIAQLAVIGLLKLRYCGATLTAMTAVVSVNGHCQHQGDSMSGMQLKQLQQRIRFGKGPMPTGAGRGVVAVL